MSHHNEPQPEQHLAGKAPATGHHHLQYGQFIIRGAPHVARMDHYLWSSLRFSRLGLSHSDKKPLAMSKLCLMCHG